MDIANNNTVSRQFRCKYNNILKHLQRNPSFFYINRLFFADNDKMNIKQWHGVCTKNKWNDNIRPKGMKVLGQLEQNIINRRV